MRDRGRYKPFHTFARERILFITGKYSPLKLDATQLYLALIVAPEMTSQTLPIINIRSPRVRKLLGFENDQRFVSYKALAGTRLEGLASPLVAKEKENARLLSADEKDIVELFGQYWTFQGLISGQEFFDSLAPGSHGGAEKPSEMIILATQFLKSLGNEGPSDINQKLQLLKEKLNDNLKKEEGPGAVSKMGLEIFYNKASLFFYASLLFFTFLIASYTERGRTFIENKKTKWTIFIPVALLVLGFGIRISITGFAPVTNMYGTMIWVSFGMSLFAFTFYLIYKNLDILRMSWLACGIFLMLTESIPLTLSPDLDPIVAVLRSNLWLTIHVLTIVISYSAFTVAMMLGNYVLIQSVIKKDFNLPSMNQISHYIYRLTQLGVFLLTVGIILGGIWADYSWGRFWGWDPKETCALIADIGYLAILHGRFTGWINAYRMAFLSPIAYFLVIFAWYGVNFILATGLHSYGFSSGGLSVVLTYVVIQMAILLIVSFYKHQSMKQVA